jgi:hypothetical protein
MSHLGMWNSGKYRKWVVRHLASTRDGHAACKTNGYGSNGHASNVSSRTESKSQVCLFPLH